MRILFFGFLFIIGACLGSFLCCQVRRLHRATKKGKQPLGPRSVCLHCGQKLAWYDNLPIVSWLVLKGCCRTCHHKIGLAEFLAEIFTALSLLLLSLNFNLSASPLEWTLFLLQLILVLVLIFLALYDGLYGELPNKFLYLALALSLCFFAINLYQKISHSGFSPDLLLQPLFAVLVLSGTYLALYLVSRGKWVGDGDWLLALPLALSLANFWLALLTLFLANLLACVISLPLVRKNSRQKVHLGPFLVAAFILVSAFSDFFLSLI